MAEGALVIIAVGLLFAFAMTQTNTDTNINVDDEAVQYLDAADFGMVTTTAMACEKISDAQMTIMMDNLRSAKALAASATKALGEAFGDYYSKNIDMNKIHRRCYVTSINDCDQFTFYGEVNGLGKLNGCGNANSFYYMSSHGPLEN